MNAVLKQTGRKLICEVVGDGEARFSVTMSGNESKMRVVRFHLTDSVLNVRSEGGNRQFAGIPTLNAEGCCKLRVESELLELWQFSRMALENLFFGD
jgi:hypothetical protein